MDSEKQEVLAVRAVGSVINLLVRWMMLFYYGHYLSVSAVSNARGWALKHLSLTYFWEYYSQFQNLT